MQAAEHALADTSLITSPEITMQKNEGNLDRALRVAAGLLLVGLAATDTIGAWGYIGIVPILTGAIGMCPLYSMLGINTCPVNRR